jgi:hypothetical protein
MRVEAMNEVDARNKATETRELARWGTKPADAIGYFEFPVIKAEGQPCSQEYLPTFSPLLRVGAQPAYVTTWKGTKIGEITHARVYRHNFGGRFVSLTVKGTNGVTYFGRASWDNGNSVILRRRQ